jgi:hypothetical protein
MKLRLVTDWEQTYPVLCHWWEGHGWPPVPLALLPSVSVIAEMEHPSQDGMVPVAFAAQYQSNDCSVAMLEWIVSNPKARFRDIYVAINALMSFHIEEAQRCGYAFMLTTCRQDSLGKIALAHGFEQTDAAVAHFVRQLTPAPAVAY